MTKDFIHKSTAFTAIILLLLCAPISTGTRVLAGQGDAIYFSPSSTTVYNGSNVTIAIRGVAKSAAADVAQLTVNFDPTRLQFISLSTAGAPINQNANYSASNGTISGGAFTTTPVSNDFLILTLVFKAVAGSGSTMLSLAESGVYPSELDSGGNSLGASLGNATVNLATAPPSPPPPPSSTKPPSSPPSVSSSSPAPSPAPTSAQPTNTSSTPTASSQQTNNVVKPPEQKAPSSEEEAGGVASAKRNNIPTKAITIGSAVVVAAGLSAASFLQIRKRLAMRRNSIGVSSAAHPAVIIEPTPQSQSVSGVANSVPPQNPEVSSIPSDQTHMSPGTKGPTW